MRTAVQFARTGMGHGGFGFRPKVADNDTMTQAQDSYSGMFKTLADAHWRECVRPDNAGANYVRPWGCFDTALHPDGLRSASYHGGYIFTTTDLWETVTREPLTRYPHFYANPTGPQPNSPHRGHPASRLEFDPAPGGDLLWCDQAAGLRYKSGGTWFLHPDVQATTTGYNGVPSCVAFDRSSAVVDGRTQRLAHWAQGRGIYLFTGGITSTPTILAGSAGFNNILDMRFDAAGTLWIVDNEQLKKWTGSGWVNGYRGGCKSIIPHPTDATKLYTINDGGTLTVSHDGGATEYAYDNVSVVTRKAPRLPWLGNTNENYMSHGGGAFSRLTNRIYIAQGISPWYCDNPLPGPGQQATVWHAYGIHFDQLCVQDARVAPNGRVGITGQDRPTFPFDIDNLSAGPSVHAGLADGVRHSQGLDFAGDDPNFWVTTTSGPSRLIVSRDGLRTFEPAPSLPSGNNEAGNIAVLTKLIWVWVPTFNRPPYVTLDGGNTWSVITLDGMAMQFSWIFTYTLRTSIVVADHANGDFYLWGYGGTAGLWKSHLGGAFTRVHNGYIFDAGRDLYNRRLRMVPDHEPHLFALTGDVAGFDSGPSADCLRFWNGTAFTTIDTLREPHDIAFAAKLSPSQAYPTLVGMGWGQVNSAWVPGFWYCTDFDPANPAACTWTLGSQYPAGSGDNYWTLGAHPNFTKGVLGFGGSGAASWSLEAPIGAG